MKYMLIFQARCLASILSGEPRIDPFTEKKIVFEKGLFPERGYPKNRKIRMIRAVSPGPEGGGPKGAVFFEIAQGPDEKGAKQN